MIYTITFSPSIDYIVNTNKEFNPNDLNRVDDYEFLPGGKGINASIVLKRIGFENKAITFLGGNTKNLFLDLLKDEKIELIDFCANNQTRINLKMFAKNSHFEINGARANIEKDQYLKLIDFINTLTSEDFVFIMGICEETYLETIVKKLFDKKVKFALDIDSKVVLDLLKYNPIILKPNRLELSNLLNKEINNIEDIRISMIELQQKGLKYVMVSDGKNGSYFLDENQDFYQIKLNKKFNIVSTVGAGDTLISSFVMIYEKTKDIIQSLKQATSLSIGTSMTRFLAKSDDIDKYIDNIEIIKY